MNAPRPLLALLPALLLALPGCERLLYAEIEQPEICKTFPDQLFTGSAYSNAIEIDVQNEIPGFDLSSPRGIESLFRMTKVEFIAKSGITNFDFVDGASVQVMAPAGTSLPPAKAIDYRRDGAATTGTLTMTGAGDVDLYEYLTNGAINVESTLSGTLPDDEWSMDIRVCLYIRVRADYLELAGSANDP